LNLFIKFVWFLFAGDFQFFKKFQETHITISSSVISAVAIHYERDEPAQ